MISLIISIILVLKSVVYIHVTGQPIGWCISDSSSGEIVSAFVMSIHECSPKTQVNVLMTDDGKSLCIITVILIKF